MSERTPRTPDLRVATPGTFNVLGANEIFGKVKFIGGNAVGPQITMELPNVMFRPANNAIGLIQDEWGQLQVEGEVLADDTGVFGTIIHPDTTLVSPLVSQYYIGKGIVSFQLMTGVTTPDIAYVDVGNVPVFEFTPNITTLAHFSSRFGVRAKDLEVITEKSATLAITMEEWTYRNLMVAFLGTAAP
jgi:hypothetical protein